MIATANRGLGSAGSQAVVAGSQLAYPTAILIGGAAAGPIGLAVGGLIALGATLAGALHIGEGCGPTCVQATSVVNQAEPTFQMNLDGYQQGVIDQNTALSNFNAMWLAIEQACGAIPGVAGQNCVSDRQAGACKWKDSNGNCWNWWVGYHDPLLQPSKVPYQGASGSSAITSLGSPLIIGGIALALGLLMAGSD